MASRNQAIEKYTQGKFQTALNIAKNFKMNVTDEQRAQMALGYECMAHEDTYVQMGYNCEVEVKKAMDVLRTVLDIHEVEEPEVEEVAPVNDVLDPDVNEVDDAANTETEWLLITSRRKDPDKLYAAIDHMAEPQEMVKKFRSWGFSFVCLVSKDKLDRLVGGNEKGCKEVVKNLTKKGVASARMFLKAAHKLAEDGHIAAVTIQEENAAVNA